MIGLTRRRIRELRRLLRRGVLGLPRSGPTPPVVLQDLGPAGATLARWSEPGVPRKAVHPRRTSPV